MNESFPRYQQFALDEDMRLLVLNYLLMKLGGQITFNLLDLAQLSKDYAGLRAVLDLEKEALTLTIKTRPDEYPRFDPPYRTRS